MKAPVVISACLVGLKTRYDGTARIHPLLKQIMEQAILVPVCPEILGGLGIPRSPSRFIGGDGAAVLQTKATIVDETGADRTSFFVRGAEQTLQLVKLISPVLIIFKERSPACGLRRVDIGGSWRNGCGVATAMLRSLGLPILSEEDSLSDFLTRLSGKMVRKAVQPGEF